MNKKYLTIGLIGLFALILTFAKRVHADEQTSRFFLKPFETATLHVLEGGYTTKDIKDAVEIHKTEIKKVLASFKCLESSTYITMKMNITGALNTLVLQSTTSCVKPSE